LTAPPQGQPAPDIRVGVYANVQLDCTSGPLPSIRLSSAPADGKVTVKKAKINATNFKQCLALEVPGYVTFYKSKLISAAAMFSFLAVKFLGGKTEVQRFNSRFPFWSRHLSASAEIACTRFISAMRVRSAKYIEWATPGRSCEVVRKSRRRGSCPVRLRRYGRPFWRVFPRLPLQCRTCRP
jgi:hypothetical protein